MTRMSPFGDALVIAHGAATLFMVGAVWFAQLVHYPLFAMIDPATFAAYQAANIRRTSRLLVLPMLAEGLCAALLLWRPPASGVNLARAGALLLAAVWASTALAQVPAHAALAEGFDEERHRALLRGNWLRVAAWTGRGAVALALLRCA